jgi:hypothetical protein
MKKKRFAKREDLGLTKAEFAILRRLSTPQKIQAFVDAIPQNFELAARPACRCAKPCASAGRYASKARWSLPLRCGCTASRRC